jgi:hypothetical protein
MDAPPNDRSASGRVVALLTGLCVALVLAVTFLLLREPEGEGAAERAAELTDPEVRRAAVERLVAASPGVFDAHTDPDVARVLLPSLEERDLAGVPVSTNSRGMREREYELPRPDGLTRVVLLGDSFVFGSGVRAEERFGVHLERWLAERGSPDARVEVLHLGIDSWNIPAECAFLRRRLSHLAPDLVLHFTVLNDIADTPGVRGFGARSRFTPRGRERADSLISDMFPYGLGIPTTNLLSAGLDWESNARLEEAGDLLVRTAEAVEAAGGRYQLILNWGRLNSIVRERWASRLGEERCAYLPSSFMEDPDWRISPEDYHWNPRGHERVARMLYALIVDRGLLPAVAPGPWDEASADLDALGGAGAEEARGPLPQELLGGPGSPLATELVLDGWDAPKAMQVHGGIDAAGRLGPYASVLLRRGDGARLELEGACLPRPELDGATLRVLVEDTEVGRVRILAGERVRRTWELPADLAEREFVSVRLVTDDYVHALDDALHCVSFELLRLALVP